MSSAAISKFKVFCYNQSRFLVLNCEIASLNFSPNQQSLAPAARAACCHSAFYPRLRLGTKLKCRRELLRETQAHNFVDYFYDKKLVFNFQGPGISRRFSCCVGIVNFLLLSFSAVFCKKWRNLASVDFYYDLLFCFDNFSA